MQGTQERRGVCVSGREDQVTRKKVRVSEGKVRCGWVSGEAEKVGGSGQRTEGKAVEVAGLRGRNCARLGRKAAEQSANLRVFGNWKTWWRTGVGTQILPRRAGDDVSAMWDRRLVRLALLQQLRAVHGIKVKSGRGQCDRRIPETAATETVGKIFGVPFNALPHSVVPEYGHIPR